MVLQQKQEELTRKQQNIKTLTAFLKQYDFDDVKAKQLSIAFAEEEKNFNNVVKLVQTVRYVGDVFCFVLVNHFFLVS